MSLDKTAAIPVDTHVWQISCRDYNIPELKKNKSLTKKAYKAIGNSLKFVKICPVFIGYIVGTVSLQLYGQIYRSAS
jgi:endonuclease III